MAAAVPALERTKRILDLLAGEPTRFFRAAEVARDTGIHRATCFSLLTSLAELGLVTRFDDGPRYTLGPSLIHYGDRSATSHGPARAARREIYCLADDLDCGVILSGRAGYEVVTLDSVDLPDDVRTDELEPGGRAPLQAPRGTIFLAWSPRAELDQWLEWSGVTGDEQRAVVRTAAALRARGYSLGADIELGLSLERVARQFSSGSSTENVDDALYDLANLVRRSGGREHGDDAVHRISAPVFDISGQVRLTLTVVARAECFVNEQIPDVAKRLLSSTDKLSAGRPATRD